MSVYIIMYWSGNHTKGKIHKLCEAFSGSKFDVPDFNNITSELEKVKESMKNAKDVYDKTKNQVRNQLLEFDSIKGEEDEDKRYSTIFIYKMFLA